jgi:5-methylcytosine-specific restriction endonuclease McrA
MKLKMETVEDLHRLQDKTINKIRACLDVSEIKNYNWMVLSKTGKSLALIYADFKCEACSNDKDLTLHHLVDRTNRDYVDERKYVIQRHSYYNLVILCKDCHYKLNFSEHKKDVLSDNEMKCLSKKTIDFAKMIVTNSLKNKVT